MQTTQGRLMEIRSTEGTPPPPPPQSEPRNIVLVTTGLNDLGAYSTPLYLPFFSGEDLYELIYAIEREARLALSGEAKAIRFSWRTYLFELPEGLIPDEITFHVRVDVSPHAAPALNDFYPLWSASILKHERGKESLPLIFRVVLEKTSAPSSHDLRQSLTGIGGTVSVGSALTPLSSVGPGEYSLWKLLEHRK